MAERARVTIQPFHADSLPVEDAMRQVLDAFALLASGSDDIIWRLVYASTNSPLTVEAEATSEKADIDVGLIARAQKARFADELRALLVGEPPLDQGLSLIQNQISKRLVIAERLFRRNLNGIGKTSISTEDNDQALLVIEPQAATKAIEAISTFHNRYNKRRVELGSIEGRLESVDTHYNKPAIRVKDRRTGAVVRCMVTPATQKEIANDVGLLDVWKSQRVRVRGKISYDKDGQIEQVDARRVERIDSKDGLTYEDLLDSQFTDGLDSSTYLDRLREGELG